MTIKKVAGATSLAGSNAKAAEARKLINEFAARLLALNDGKTIPARWRHALMRALGPPNRRGAPQTRETRDIAIAHSMLLHDLDIEGKRTTTSRSKFAETLQDEYGVDQSYILKAACRYRIAAMEMEVWAGIDLERIDEDDEAS